MHKKTDFCEFEEARLASGLFFAQALEELRITERTYYRWKRSGTAPRWAVRIMELSSGDLDRLGWNHWYIEKGRLYSRQLNARYRGWTCGDLLAQQFNSLQIPRLEKNQPVGWPLRTGLYAKDS